MNVLDTACVFIASKKCSALLKERVVAGIFSQYAKIVWYSFIVFTKVGWHLHATYLLLIHI